MITFSELAGSIFERKKKYEDPELSLNSKGFGVISEKQYNFIMKLAKFDPNAKMYPEQGSLCKTCEGIAKIGKTKEIPFSVYVHALSSGKRYAIYSEVFAEWPYEHVPPVIHLPDMVVSADDVQESTPFAEHIEQSVDEYAVKIASYKSSNGWFRSTGIAFVQPTEHDTYMRAWSKHPGKTNDPHDELFDILPHSAIQSVKLPGCGKKTTITFGYIFREDGMAFPIIHSTGHQKI